MARAAAYATRISSPTLNAALCLLISRGLEAVERDEQATAVAAAPRQRGAR